MSKKSCIFAAKRDLYLEIIDAQTTLYFATFESNGETMKGHTAVTVKKGETKENSRIVLFERFPFKTWYDFCCVIGGEERWGG